MWKLIPLLCLLIHPFLAFCLRSQKNSTSQCHNNDKMTLLQFKNEFTVNSNYSDMYDDVLQNGPSYPKTNSWNINTDCCSWDGVICDSISGHVIGLDLSCSQLGGIISSNTTLFHLSHLKTLNLAYNYFYPSRIPPVIGNLTNLKHLNLSHTGFVGEVPIEFAALSQLVSLDLTIPTLVGSEVEIFTMMGLPYSFSGLKFSDFHKIVKNLTNLQQLHLNGVVINSSIPQILENLTSLTSLQLYNCSLQGTFPSKISTLPNLRSLIVELNPNLYVHTSHLKNLSSSLQVLDFAYTNFSGRLPECSHGSEPNLRMFSISGCNLWGQIPIWVWNTSEVLMLADNRLSGDLPATMDTKKTQNLQSITNIVLSNNLLKGIIPSWLFTLPSLIELNLGGNQFSDMVKEGILPTEVSKLQFMDLSRNGIRGKVLDFVSKFDGLVALNISDNNVTGYLPKSLAKLISLQLLDLSVNKLEGTFPPQLTTLIANLSIFNVSKNQLVGPIPPEFTHFSNSSFEGNLGLCGPPLSKSCESIWE